jgi:DNA-binding NarL/FixJ family response regulator
MTIEVLSRVQREILSLCAAGLSSPEIGKKIHRSPKTVRNQLSVIYEKLGVDNRVQAATYMARCEIENRDI